MGSWFLSLPLVFLSFLILSSSSSVSGPEQVHLIPGDDLSEMVVMWVTATATSLSSVTYSDGSKTLQVTGEKCETYEWKNKVSPCIHTVKLTGLSRNTIYSYQVDKSDNYPASKNFTFTTALDSTNPFVIGVIGDPGQTNHSLDTYKGVSAENPELLVIAGDLSYADGDMDRWDSWGRMAEFLLSKVPLLAIPGNHENDFFQALQTPDTNPDHFLPYRKRFHFPATPSNGLENFYYSYNYKLVHFIFLSSETPYDETSSQFEWLKNDLSAVDPTATPWIVATWHRPWYNSNKAHQKEGEKMRMAMEDLIRCKVDIVLNGHVHAYERTKPVYQYSVQKDAPVYIIVGDGGNREGLADEYNPMPDWSAIRMAEYGHSKFIVYNSTTLYWEMKNDNGSIGDATWIIKQNRC